MSRSKFIDKPNFFLNRNFHFRYIVDDSRVLFLLQDGSQVYEIKDYLVAQDRCQEVTIDNRPYYGKGAKV
jgi:hypothetical protein